MEGHQGRDSRLEAGTLDQCCLPACSQGQLALEGSRPLLYPPKQVGRQCWSMLYDYVYAGSHSWLGQGLLLEVKLTGLCHS